MRKLIVSLPPRLQVFVVTGCVIAAAFIVANISCRFFDLTQLKDNTDLISSVYQVMGTIYAILLTFTLWGVWQNYTAADEAVQKETYALLDLVHMLESAPRLRQHSIRHIALTYLEGVVKQEWATLKTLTSSMINNGEHSRSTSLRIVNAVNEIDPQGDREVAIYSHALTLLSEWLDARRTRILMARGNSAHALWPLLVIGAVVLFAFHGLFVAESTAIWAMLLGGTSLVIGITFYLIFSLDCPFGGSPSVDSEPFNMAIYILKKQMIAEPA